MSDKTKAFIKAIAIRAARTFCQAVVGAIGGSVAMGDVNWGLVASTATLATIGSICMSIATGLPEVEPKL